MAGNRCDSCSKMVSLEFQEPEAEDLEVTEGHVTGTVMLKRNCGECGGEMRQAQLDIDVMVEGTCELHADGHEKTVEINDLNQLEEGGGRYKKSYFGAEGTITVSCSCGVKAEVPWSDKVAAGDFDDV